MNSYANILAKLGEDQPWSSAREKSIIEPYTYCTSTPGKDIRKKLIDSFNLWLNVPEDKLNLIANIVNMLHNASLLFDDIEDDSQLRRGQPVAHKIYGVPQTINAATYILIQGYQEVAKLRDSTSADCIPDFDRIVTEELLSLHRGQGLDILWRDSLTCPTEDEYISMVNQKTSGLLRLGIKLMMACATTNKGVNYVPLVNLIGVYFQIRDDLMNLDSTEYARNKGFAEDLTEGKFSFPIVHGIHTDTSNRHLLNVLQKRPSTPTLKIHAIEYLRNRTKSFEYTQNVLDSLEMQTLDEVRRLGGNVGLDHILRLLHVDGPKPDSPI